MGNPVFDLLNAVGKKDYWVALEETPPTVHPFVALQWMKSGVEYQRLQSVNYRFFEYPSDIQYSLLAVAATPGKQQYRWSWLGKPHNEQVDRSQQLISAIQSHYEVDRSTAQSVIDLLTPQEQYDLISAYDSGDTSKKTSTKKRKTTK